MKEIITLIFVVFLMAVLTHKPFTQEQREYIAINGGFSGVGVMKKPDCTPEQFQKELQARKNDVGFRYTLDYFHDGYSYAMVNNYGNVVRIEHEEVPYKPHIYNGWGNAFLAYRQMAIGLLDSERFNFNFKQKLKAHFDHRMNCVKFGGIFGVEKAM